MKFLDEARIDVKAGNGGAGLSHFRREKFVPMGGPDGGDGGHGGSVFIVADPNRHTLLDLHLHPKWQAKDGKAGGTSRCNGRCGADLSIPVPVGTQIFDGSGSLIADLDTPEQVFPLAKGGRGGKGNAHFKSSTNRAPEHSQPGEEGQSGTFSLILKLVADVGLMGLPNAGKSTLISRISDARPKIADYPFTTLTPNLGVVRYKGEKSFVVADIPGLIPGAHEGKGLGIKFLKHIERTRVLIHLIDINQAIEDSHQGNPLASFQLINNELKSFSDSLVRKPQFVVFSKLDSVSDESEVKVIMKAFKKAKVEAMAISSVTGQGLDELLKRIGQDIFPIVSEDPR